MFEETQRPSSSLGDDTPQSVPGRLLAIVALRLRIVLRQMRSGSETDSQKGDSREMAVRRLRKFS